MSDKHEFENFKKIGNIADGLIGAGFGIGKTLIFLWIVVLFPLAIVARCMGWGV